MEIDWSYSIFFIVVSYIIYEVLWSDVGLTRSHHEVRMIQVVKNLKRGITMTPGFTYIDPDGTRCMSPTGRAQDCSCGGTHPSHLTLNADISKNRRIPTGFFRPNLKKNQTLRRKRRAARRA